MRRELTEEQKVQRTAKALENLLRAQQERRKVLEEGPSKGQRKAMRKLLEEVEAAGTTKVASDLAIKCLRKTLEEMRSAGPASQG